MKKTVFFGPFVGEFGWELLFWQGWVRKVCKTTYKDYRKIASSFAGREAFYPYVDEFWAHPDQITSVKVSQRHYISDMWKEGFPVPDIKVSYPNFGPIAEALLEKYKKTLPEDTVYYVPFYTNRDNENDFSFGVKEFKNDKGALVFEAHPIPFSKQDLESIKPTQKGKEAFKNIYSDNQKIIAIFPRNRAVRRPDKNWTKENYDELINLLQKKYGNQYKVAVFGEPGGAFYVDGVPEGVLDLINVPKELRMDIQVVALQNSVLALGSMSGAILFALACGTPSITWGYFNQLARYYKENFINTKFIYWPQIKVSPKIIFKYSKVILENKSPLFMKVTPLMKKASKLVDKLNSLKKKFDG